MNPIRLVCLALATILVLSGCGDAGNAGSAAGADGGLTGEPIKIGQIAPTGTAIYNAPDSIAVAKAAIRGINARGGINGRPLEYVYCNDQADPNKAAACAREMVSEKVVTVVRSVIIAGGPQVTAILQAAGIPEIGRGAIAPVEYKAPNAYLLDGGLVYAYVAALKYFADHGGKKVFLAVTDAPTASSHLQAFSKLIKDLGLTLAGTQRVAANTADYAPFVASIAQSGADGALLSFPQQLIVQSIKAGDQAGLRVDWLVNSGGLNENDVRALPGAQRERLVVAGTTLPLSAAAKNGAVARMKADIEAEVAAGNADADPAKLFGNALLAYAAVNSLPTLLKNAPSIDAKGLTAALDTTKDIPLGILPPWTPGKAGPPNFTRVSNPYVYLNVVRNNQIALASPEPIDAASLLK